ALLVPTILPDGDRSLPARAAWHLVRPDIGYPLTVDRAHPGHLLAGAWGQVYQSWDSGASWSQLAPLPDRLVIRALAIDASQPDRYLVATKHSIFLSTDGGRSWTLAQASLPGGPDMFLMQDPRSPATFYAGPSILWKSSDHGATWGPDGRGLVFAPDGIQSLEITPNGELLAGIWRGGVGVSHNGGLTWERRARGLDLTVMDVAAGLASLRWAGTDRGVFHSTNDGLRWHRVSLPGDFSVTSLLVLRHAVVAAGDQALYRSSDGGKHWSMSMSGLPLDPYVSGLVADPFHAGRIYASLNSDGLFRSDDGGRQWTPIDHGIPLKGDLQPAHHILFRRLGALWITDAAGTDPGVLTVERDVDLAALTPDEAAVAYVSDDRQGWAVRILNAGGSAARTLQSGTGHPPGALLWSQNSSSLAIVREGSVTVTDLSRTHTWPLGHGDRVVTWSADGRALLLWNAQTHRITERQPLSGVQGATRTGQYSSIPVIAPNGKYVATRENGAVAIGTWGGPLMPVPALQGCRPLAWSSDSSRVLVTCRASVAEVTAAGAVTNQVRLPGPVRWAPGSSRSLLFFSHGDLFRWTPAGSRLLVQSAHPVLTAR
ncbi:MAG: hypothetical protein M3Z66_16355, partial [Chloroflexota bacterium]|nr:hypothetical protein [Chloroflexota bacterium]